jgi:hypothetical protein
MRSIMKPSIIKLLTFFNFFFVTGYGQEFIPNTCDSTLLSKTAYEKCKADSAWTADIVIKTNYIIEFKTHLLPKYRLIRKNISIPPTLQKSLQELKMIYDTVLNKKLSIFQTDMDSNQQFMQPKAYLSSLLSFQRFKFYPDIYAVLLNEIHLQLTPRTTIDELNKFKRLFDITLAGIPLDLYSKLLKISNELVTDNSKLVSQGYTPMFQGSIEETYRRQCNIINFLLWTK